MSTQLHSEKQTKATAERRRHPRHPIVLSASLKFSQGKDLPCVIRNFCLTGVYCQLQGSPSSLPPKDSAVEIVFRLPDQGQVVHSLGAKLVRADDNGLGLAFDAPMSESLFEAFFELAQASQGKSAASPKIPDSQQLLEFCRSHGRQIVLAAAEKLFEEVEEKLLDASDTAKDNTSKINLLDASSLCKQNAKELQDGFLKRFEDRIEQFFSNQLPLENTTPLPAQRLSLVDQQNFEDWLNLSENAAKIENQYQAALRKIDYIFAAATQRAMDSARSPLIPTTILDCLRQTLDEAELTDQHVRTILYRTLAENLAKLYGSGILWTFSQVFGIPLDDLPPLAKPVNSAGSTSAPAKAETDRESTEDPSQEDSNLPSHPKPAQAVPQPPAQPSRGEAGGILRSLALFAQSQNSESSPGHPTDPGQLLPTQEIVGLLPRLQNLTDQLDAKTLETKLLALAKESGKGGANLGMEHKGLIQASCQMTEALLSEAGQSPTIQEQLGQLRLPLIKIAMTEPALLEDENSPATEMINYLGRLEQYLAQDPIKFKTISSLLEHSTQLLLKQDSNIQEVLEKTNTKLRRLLAPLVKKQRHLTQRLINSYEGRQKIALSKLNVYKEIIHRMAKGPVPEIAVNLLDAGWQHLLVLTILRHGKESENWNKRLKTLDKLLAWLSTNPDTQLPEREILNLLDHIDTDLAVVCGDVVRHRKIVSELASYLIGNGTPKVRETPNLIQVEASHFADHTIAAYLDMPRTDEIEGLAVGDWLAILEQGNRNTFKLVWIGEFPPIFVFVDATSTQKLELTSQQLMKMLEDGRAEKSTNHDFPLMDRVSDRMLHNMFDAVVQQDLEHDPSTGFLDQQAFISYLKGLSLKSRGTSSHHVLCRLEFDLFQVIVSVCGATAGEAFLSHIARLLSSHLPEGTQPARLGDNAVGLILPDHHLDRALPLITRLRDAIIASEFKSGDHEYTIDTRIGLTLFTPRDTVKQVLLNVHTACMKAKDSGENAIQIYREDDAQIKKQQNLLMWAGQLNSLFKEDRLYLRCQKIAALTADNHGHYEILIGASDKNGGFLPPDGFIPALEHFKRTPELDKWVIEKAMAWMLCNPGKLDKIGGFSINLSGLTVINEKFLVGLEKLLLKYKRLTDKLTFEITETAAVDNFHQAAKFIRRIKRLGCRFSLDDFGTGYASYAYLKNMDFDYLKIDGSFIKDIVHNEADALIVKSMNDIGHSLGLKTVAEYVENEAVLEKLKEIGVDYGQGYGIEKPMPLTQLLSS